MRRFWDHADCTVRPDGIVITLDGKPMRLPNGQVLCLQNRPLAEAIAAEWQAAGGARDGMMGPDDVRLTGLAGAAQDIAADPAPTIDALGHYAESDLLCYRAEAPEALGQRQMENWQPWLDWAATALGAPLRVTSGVIFVAQAPTAVVALRRAVAGCEAGILAGLGVVVPATGSLVLGLAMACLRLDAVAAQRLADLDETFQNELWGEDMEAVVRRDRIAADLHAAARFMRLVRGEALLS